jgi:putative peptidoglycan lipid II flippase
LPAAVGLALLAGPIITTLFHYGAFTAADVSMATLALTTYCLGLPAFIGVKVLAPAFFSRQDATTPVRVAVIALVTNMALNVVFVLTLAHFWSAGDWQLGLFATLAEVPGLHAGLALASSLTAWLNAYLLWRGLGRVDLAPTMSLKRLSQVGVAAGAMAGVLWTGLSQLQPWLEISLLARAVQLGLAVAIGAGAYATILWFVGVRPTDFYRPDSTQTR